LILVPIVKDVFHKIRQGEIRWISGSLAFTSVLSVIPFLALTLVTFKMIGGLDYLSPKIESLILSYFKEAVGGQATEWVKIVLGKVQAKTFGSTALIALLITSWRLFNDMEQGIQKIWSSEIKRPLHKRFFVVWFSLLLFPTFLAVYVGFRSLELVKPLVKQYSSSVDGLALFIILFLIYYIFPADKVLKRVAFFSSLFSCLGIVILQRSFTWIAKEAFYINKFYGGLAAIPLFLIWILVIWQIILIGTALGASIQKNLLKK
jgi:membrane protein